MTDLLKAMSSPPSTVVERSSETEEARVESLDHVDGARGTLLVIETTAKVADTALEWGLLPLSCSPRVGLRQ